MTNKKIIVHGVSFEPGTAALRPGAKPVLDEAVKILRRESPATVIIAGLPPEDGDASLASQRARALQRYLVAAGVAPLFVATSGPELTLTATCDAVAIASRPQARCVELEAN